MSNIRILLAGTSLEVQDVLATAVIRHRDLVLTPGARDEVETLLSAEYADVVVIEWRGDDRAPAVAERLLDEYPGIGIVAIDLKNDRALMHDRVPRTTVIGPVTADSVVAAIRRAAISCESLSPSTQSESTRPPHAGGVS